MTATDPTIQGCLPGGQGGPQQQPQRRAELADMPARDLPGGLCSSLYGF